MTKEDNQCEVRHCRGTAELNHIPLGMRICYKCYEKYCSGETLEKVK